MDQFDKKYKEIMETMTAGGVTSVFSSPANQSEIGLGGGAVGVDHSRFYGEKDGIAIPKSIFGTVQIRNLNKGKNKPRKKSNKK
jgi:hypothetical protein